MKSQIAHDLIQVVADLRTAKSEDFTTVTFKVKGDAVQSILKILKQCEHGGNVGHSFAIIVDPQGGEDKRESGFDGDGDDRVKDIVVNGKPLARNFEW
jgi:hypothetical protein